MILPKISPNLVTLMATFDMKGLWLNSYHRQCFQEHSCSVKKNKNEEKEAENEPFLSKDNDTKIKGLFWPHRRSKATFFPKTSSQMISC